VTTSSLRVPGLDLDRLRSWLADRVPGAPADALSAELVTGGRSNRTYTLAAVLEGIHFRYLNGQTMGPSFDEAAQVTGPLLAAGLSSLEEYRKDAPR
jgi:hypothetical protein